MMTWLPVIIMQFCTFAHAGSSQEYRLFLYQTSSRKRVFDYSRRIEVSAASCLHTATDGDDDDRSATTTHRFFLCARQCDHDQDHDGPGRMGQRAKRGAQRRPVFLGMERRQPVHV